MLAAKRQVILSKAVRYALDYFSRQQMAAAYSTRKLKAGATSPFKITTDTGYQFDARFTSSGEFDVNHANGVLNRNLVADIPLGVDANANGVSDGWIYSVNGATGDKSVSDGYQKIDMIASTLISNYVNVYKDISCVGGNSVTITGTGRVSGNVYMMIRINWYNGETYLSTISSSNYTNTSDTLLTLTAIAPPTTTKVVVTYRIFPNAGGDTGSAWFKDASVTISNQSAYVSQWTDQSGNGNHAVQTTFANMPRICNAGVWDRDFDATKANALYPTFSSASGVTLVSNGDFSGGTTGWNTDSSTGSVSNNTYTNTGNGTNLSAVLRQTTNTPVVVGKRYFIRAKVRVTNSNCSYISLYTYNGTAVTTAKVQSNPVINEWYTLSTIVSHVEVGSTNLQVRCLHAYADAATANGKVMEVQEVVAIDVTELGKPCCRFIRVGDTSTNPNLVCSTYTNGVLVQPNVINAIINFAGGVTSGTGAKYVDGGSDVNNRHAIGYQVSSAKYEMYSSNSVVHTGSKPSDNMQHIFTNFFNITQSKFYADGALITTDLNTGNYNMVGITIGARISNANQGWNGTISELIVFDNILSDSQRQRLERNQGKYYNIAI